MVEVSSKVFAAVEILGPDLVCELARALVRARELHPEFAKCVEDAAGAIHTESCELICAIVDHEEEERQHAEARDVAVTAIRFMRKEWMPKFSVTTPPQTSEEYFQPKDQVWGDDASRGVSEAQVDTNSENMLRGDMINHPPHYTTYPVEVIDMIRAVLGPEGFKAYCFGNEIKYRMRAGLKDSVQQDIDKAMKYKEFRNGLE